MTGSTENAGEIQSLRDQCSKLVKSNQDLRDRIARIYIATGSDESCEPLDEHLSEMMNAYEQDIEALTSKLQEIERMNSECLKPLVERLDTLIAIGELKSA